MIVRCRRRRGGGGGGGGRGEKLADRPQISRSRRLTLDRTYAPPVTSANPEITVADTCLS